MDKDMNIPGIGKRMPYNAPDRVLDDIERNVLSATGCGRKLSHRFRTASVAIAVVASLALFAIFSWHRQPAENDSLMGVQQAFSDLDNADREFLSDIYNEDIFMNINY